MLTLRLKWFLPVLSLPESISTSLERFCPVCNYADVLQWPAGLWFNRGDTQPTYAAVTVCNDKKSFNV